jgi:hypothetical protein
MINSKLLLILFSVILAFFFWIQTVLIKEQQSTIKLPVIYTNKPVKIDQSELPTHARFNIKGRGFEILKLRFYNIQAKLDASEFLNLKSDLAKADYEINIPPNINVQVLGPVAQDNASIQAVVATSSFLPIEIDFDNDTTREYFYKMNFRLVQNKVEVRGAKNILENLQGIKTLPINYNNLKKNKFSLKLVSPSSDIVLGTEYVDVNKSNTYLVSKVISNVPIQTVPNYSIFPKEVTIRVRGQNEQIGVLTPEQIVATLRVKEEIKGQIPLQITLPPGIELLDYSPKFVTDMDKNAKD